MFGTLAHDGSVAWRGLIRKPFYPIATIIMLAFAIAANATAFGIFYGFLLRPLPYRDPRQIKLVGEFLPNFNPDFANISPSAYRVIRRDIPQMADAGLYSYGGAAPVMIAHHPKAITYSRETPSFFRTLGVVPLLGRLPSLAAGRQGGPAEITISAKFWHSAYDGNRNVLNHRLTVNGIDYRIVGVLPRDYAFNAGADAQLPLVLPIKGLREQTLNSVMIVRTPANLSAAQANLLLADALPQIRKRVLPRLATMFGHGLKVETRKLRPSFTAGSSLGALPWVLQGTALLLLLLAIANAANLALVRHRSRLHEFALRRVLGGSGADLMRLLFLEQIPLFAVISATGTILAWLGARFILSYGSAIVSPPFRFGFGWDDIACVLVLSVVSLLVVTIAPIMLTSRLKLQSAIGQGPKSTLGRGARIVQRGLGIGQIALAFALLAGSLTLTVSLHRFLNRPLGFQPDHHIVASILAPKSIDMTAAMEPAIARLRQQSYVRSVTGVGFGTRPFSHSNATIPIRRMAPGSKPHNINVTLAGDNFFSAMDIHILKGRALRSLDQQHGAKVVVLGAGSAQRLFGTTNIVGRMVHLVLLGDFRVVGVAAPVVWRSKPWNRTFGTVYVPASSFKVRAYPVYVADIIVNVRDSIHSAGQDAKKLIESAIPGAVVTSVRPYHAIIARYLGFRHLAASIVSIFAVLALVLAALGVYAVNAFIARARLPEYGMRAMLGASPQHLLRLALTDAAWLLGLGLASGLIGGFLLVRAMLPLLFHVNQIAPAVFAISLAIIAIIVLAAAWRPAARAANTPVKTLLDAG
ncbi:ABC transporter permease [Acidiphilium iwatense]|uniref:ABC transporter permease n=1 Tax=Acidiphilium iwatense TaxID=768198 RepID=A0ABS9DZ40_9PROT|nr:ABC transporter permease [Acidiphilium iwatense]MCF3947953.1 ABC transporter permease [Acidiphilium iwatense]